MSLQTLVQVRGQESSEKSTDRKRRDFNLLIHAAATVASYTHIWSDLEATSYQRSSTAARTAASRLTQRSKKRARIRNQQL